MTLSRRSLLTSLIAAPAVISIDRLMPIKLWLPTIYGDAIHDDYEGLLAWLKGERVNILPRGFSHNDDVFNIGHGVFRTSRPLRIPPNTSIVGRGETSHIKGDPDLPYVIGWEAPISEKVGEFTVEAHERQVSTWGLESGLGKFIKSEKYTFYKNEFLKDELSFMKKRN